MPITINGSTGIAGVDGSAAAPAVRGTDADSGVYFNSSGQIGLSTNSGGAALTIDSNSNVTFPATVVMGSPFAMRNKIINGAFEIDQRYGGAAVTPTGSQYVIDRWAVSISQASKLTIQQLTTAGFGFKYYQRVLVAATATVGAGDYFGVQQLIEGTNCTDLEWGTATAKTVTLSFWAYSTVAGTYGGSLRNSANNRSYPFTYVLPGSTWTYITITIPGDTSGTWLTDTGVGVNIYFSVGMGSTFSGTAGAWAGANYASATGAASIMGTSSAVFAITGVQFEVGTKATPFERRLFGVEYLLCQRYCQLVGSNISGMVAGTTEYEVQATYFFPMRTSATLSVKSGGVFNVRYFGDVNITNPTIANAGGDNVGCWLQVISSGLTNGTPVFGRHQNAGASNFLIAEAEL